MQLCLRKLNRYPAIHRPQCITIVAFLIVFCLLHSVLLSNFSVINTVFKFNYANPVLNYVDHVILNNIGFIETMVDNGNNNTLQCNPFNFKYMKLLLQELIESNYSNIPKYTSDEFDNFYHLQNKYCSQYSKDQINPMNIIRLKSFSGKLYYDSNITTLVGYHRVYVSYFVDLFRRFSKYIPDFDITIYTMDSFNHKFNWKDRNSPVCFIAEGMFDDTAVNIGLHTISRSFLRQIYNLNMQKKKPNEMFNINQYKNEQYFIWKNKKNKAVFRGSPFLFERDKLAYFINYNLNNDTSQYFDVKLMDSPIHRKNHAQPSKPFCANYGDKNTSKCWTSNSDMLSWTDELKYKYVIVMDGLGVRDAFSRQIQYNSVILKKNSRRKTFWYYDVVDKQHYFIYKNNSDLINLMSQFQNGYYTEDELSKIAYNGYKYSEQNFNFDKLDCFTIHMINLYNYFFYNKSSITINQYDIEIPWYKHVISYDSLRRNHTHTITKRTSTKQTSKAINTSNLSHFYSLANSNTDIADQQYFAQRQRELLLTDALDSYSANFPCFWGESWIDSNNINMNKKNSELNDGGKWGCGIHLIQKPCIIYSFGSFNNFKFEYGINEITNYKCDIYIFDPFHYPSDETIENLENLNIHFYKWGVSGINNETANIYTLERIMTLLNHTFIDVLKIDIEGFEYPTFYHLDKQNVWPSIGQILIETHTADDNRYLWNESFGSDPEYYVNNNTNFDQVTRKDMLGSLIETFEKHNFRIFHRETNMVFIRMRIYCEYALIQRNWRPHIKHY
eukprot:453136_1